MGEEYQLNIIQNCHKMFSKVGTQTAELHFSSVIYSGINYNNEIEIIENDE